MRAFPLLLTALFLGGCGAISAVSDASAPLEAFTLAPARPTQTSSGSRHIVVPVAAASGAISTDRILIKPTSLQAAYLPEARWVDPAPVLMQSLLVESLQATNAFRLVSRDDAGLQPDYILLLDLAQFQAEAPTTENPSWSVRVGLMATVIRDEDRRIVAARRFDATATAASDQPGPVINAFNAATGEILATATDWVVRQTR